MHQPRIARRQFRGLAAITEVLGPCRGIIDFAGPKATYKASIGESSWLLRLLNFRTAKRSGRQCTNSFVPRTAGTKSSRVAFFGKMVTAKAVKRAGCPPILGISAR